MKASSACALLVLLMGASSAAAATRYTFTNITTFPTFFKAIRAAGATTDKAPGELQVYTFAGKYNGEDVSQQGTCIAGETKDDKVTFHCVFQFNLPGGSVQAAGVQTAASGSGVEASGLFSITGGTGKYLGAYGTDTLTAIKGGASDTLEIYVP